MKRHGCEVEGSGINYTINLNGTRRKVLKNVGFKASPWEILAIVGPSGAGKSSLLEILAGRLVPQSASINVNGQPVERTWFRKMSGYVTQKDTLFPFLTVEETLRFSAKLRLSLPEPELSERVESLMKELGVTHVAGERVGDDRVRGISGGERRRVSIGIEVIHSPEVVILDEPTSGLDSCSALQIIDMLKKMAETKGRTVVLSIHQPGFRIVKLFNSVLLLADGAVLHHGGVDLLSINMTMMGLEIPHHVNVLEHAIESIDAIKQQQQTDGESPPYSHKKEGLNRAGRSTLQQLFQQSKVVDEGAIRLVPDSPQTFANSRIRETAILTHRFWRNISRTKELFAGRSIAMLVSGLVLGSIFYHLKDGIAGTQERIGLFAFILTFLLTSTIDALPIFLPFLFIQAVLFSIPLYWLVGLNPSLTAFGHFLLLIWIILYTANSLVICFSSLVPNFIIGNSVISAVMGGFFLFSGYFVSQKAIPDYWIFMHYISLFKYPFEGLVINEFAGKKCLDFMMGNCVFTGDDVLREQGFIRDDNKRWRNYVIMVCFILVYRFMGYIVLRCKCSGSGIRGIFLIPPTP